jgi:type I restriction enzyme S subunit
MATSQDSVNWICSSELDPTFLMHLLRASRKYLRSLSSGAIHKTIYFPTVKAFNVCVPPIDEQRRIANLLDQQMAIADKVLVAAQAQVEMAESLPSRLLQRAFTGSLL